MLYLGFLLISLAAGLMLYEKTERMKRERDEYFAVLSLLLYFKGGIAAERHTPAELFIGFSKKDEARAIPWLSSLDGGDRVTSFMRERRILSAVTLLSDADKKRLSELFSELGMHTASEEGERLGGEIARFSAIAEEKKVSCEKSIKAYWLLFLTVTLGIFIIIL